MTLQDNRKIWDYHQTSAPEVMAQSYHRLRYISRLLKDRGDTAALLDIGIGNGDLLDMLCTGHRRCFGIDISEANIRMTKDRFANSGMTIELALAQIDALPYADGTFDAVTASEVIEHLDEKDLAAALAEVYRVLKPGGVFIATVPACETLAEQRCLCPNCGYQFHRWGHQQSFSANDLRRCFAARFNADDIAVSARIFRAPGLNATGRILHGLKWIKNAFGMMTSDTHFIVRAVKRQ